jgi:hypothetical protein
VAEPGTAVVLGVAVPGAVVLGVAEPGTAAPGAVVIGVAVPGAVVLGVAVPGAVVLGVAVPGAVVLGVAVPGAVVLGVAEPGTAMEPGTAAEPGTAMVPRAVVVPETAEPGPGAAELGVVGRGATDDLSGAVIRSGTEIGLNRLIKKVKRACRASNPGKSPLLILSTIEEEIKYPFFLHSE